MEYELYHHGTKGMKWGRRRYQNADGSLTALGRIRYGAGKAAEGAKTAVKKAADNRKAKKAAEKESERINNLMKKPISKLSESELAERTARAKKEQLLRETEKNRNTDDLRNKLIKDVLVPSAISAGKSALTKFMTNKLEDVLGIGSVNTRKILEKLGGEFDKLTDEQAKALAEREKNINTARQQRKQREKVDG